MRNKVDDRPHRPCQRPRAKGAETGLVDLARGGFPRTGGHAALYPRTGFFRKPGSELALRTLSPDALPLILRLRCRRPA
jgi:hypothetical protein